MLTWKRSKISESGSEPRASEKKPQEEEGKNAQDGEAHYDLNQICLVLEYIEADIDLMLKNQLIITENIIKRIIYNLLCSLAYMHMMNVMHRDIKPANILISSDCSVKLCDFGLSRTLPQGQSNFLINASAKYEV